MGAFGAQGSPNGKASRGDMNMGQQGACHRQAWAEVEEAAI